MGMTRVWNVTSDPSTNVPVQNLMVLGKLLKPGQSMQVDEGELKTAHKTTKNIAAGLLAVGKTAPGFLARAAKATLPAGLARSHGAVDAKPEVKAVEVKAPARAETKAEEPKREENGRGFPKHKR